MKGRSRTLELEDMMSAEVAAKTVQTYQLYIEATPQAIWDALTLPELTVRYGYAPVVEYELKRGGAYRAMPNDGMKAMGITGAIVDGEVLEVEAPRRLVQTWRMLMEPSLAAEGFTRLSVDIEPVRGGVTKVTLAHDVTGAPGLASLVAGAHESRGAGGGWNEVLSGLKTLLETGHSLPFQSGPEEGDCAAAPTGARSAGRG
jgi:uncharacterized protein YndB with AHSA1/START domain